MHDRLCTGSEIADRVIRIAESRSFSELGAACHHAASTLTGASAFGFYLLQGGQPSLVYSRNAPWGFLEDYRRELAPIDPLLDCIMEARGPVSGEALRRSAAFNTKVMFDLLERWGFRHNMCCPILQGKRIAGVIYTASADPAHGAQDVTVERMSYICRSASLALRAILTDADRPECRGSDDDVDAAFASGAWANALPTRSAEVARRLCRGETNKEIARAMAISHHTVKEHVSNLCRRFHVQNRTELVSLIVNLVRRNAGDARSVEAAPYDGIALPFTREYSGEYF